MVDQKTAFTEIRGLINQIKNAQPDTDIEKLKSKFGKCVHIKGYTLSEKYIEMVFERDNILSGGKQWQSREQFEKYGIPYKLNEAVDLFNDAIRAGRYDRVLFMMCDDGLTDCTPLQDLIERTSSYEDIELVRTFATKYDLLDKVDMNKLVAQVERVINPNYKRELINKIKNRRM